MQHLTEEQLVAHYYLDDDAPAAANEHLAECAACAAELDAISRVLALVKEAPVPERGDDYGSEVWTRLRWRLGARNRRKQWQWLAVAAVMGMGVCTGGIVWSSRHPQKPAASVAQANLPATNAAQNAGKIAGATQNRACRANRVVSSLNDTLGVKWAAGRPFWAPARVIYPEELPFWARGRPIWVQVHPFWPRGLPF